MRARRSIVGRSVALMLGSLVLAGCSSVPNAVNPVEWYKGARDIVTGKDDSKPAATSDNRLSAEADQPPPGADEPIPSVNTVPPRPKVSSADERDKVASALVADQQGARRYSGEVIKRQGEVAAAAPPPRPAAAAVPVPTAPTPSAPPPAAQLPTPSQQAAAVMSSPAPSAPVAAGPTADQVAAAAPTPPPAVGGSAPTPAPTPTPAPGAAPSAPRTPPQMRQVAAAPPTPPPPAPGQPIQPSNIVIPPDNPTAPKMNEVKPYTPPPGMSDYETVYVTGAPGQGGEGRAAGPRRSLAASATAGAQAKAPPSPSSRGSYQVATIQFTNGSSRLSESDRRILAQVEAQHRQVGGTLRVVGHTAGRAESDDQTVSQARADAVAAELERLGAKPDQVRTAAVGDSEPKYAESSPNGIAGNRRTEIFIDF